MKSRQVGGTLSLLRIWPHEGYGISNSFWTYYRHMELYEDSPSSSEHSTGSTLVPHSAGENLEHSLHQSIGTELTAIQIGDQKGGGCDQVVLSGATLDQGKIIKFHYNRKLEGKIRCVAMYQPNLNGYYLKLEIFI